MASDIPSPAPTILVVTDQAAVRSLVCATLQAGGYHTLEAADGLTGWQMLSAQRDRIHCLVTDFILPGLNGVSLVELARELRPRLPVLIMSGQSHTHITRIFPSLKDVSFLRTPFRDDDLLAVIETLLPPRA